MLTYSHIRAILTVLTESHIVKEVIDLTNGQMLKDIIYNRHFTVSDFADRLGLSRQGFFKKMTNRSEFKQSEIEKATKILGLSMQQEKEIFFADIVDN